MVYARNDPLIVMSPSVARVFAANGWTKDHIRRHLCDNHIQGPSVSRRVVLPEKRPELIRESAAQLRI